MPQRVDSRSVLEPAGNIPQVSQESLGTSPLRRSRHSPGEMACCLRHLSWRLRSPPPPRANWFSRSTRPRALPPSQRHRPLDWSATMWRAILHHTLSSLTCATPLAPPAPGLSPLRSLKLGPPCKWRLQEWSPLQRSAPPAASPQSTRFMGKLRQRPAPSRFPVLP